MKKLPTGVQSIREILEGDLAYVDKTEFAKNLIDDGKHYFLSRPRRFGKSLFLNTLEEIFKGNRELFKRCQITKSNHDWQSYPVLHFDLAQIAGDTPQALKEGLQAEVGQIGKAFGVLVEGPSMQFQLKVLIEELSKKNRVVVLVDEYDNPIINNLKNLEVAEANRDILKAFFATLKSLDRYLKFTFVTGVSKFSQVSLFSGPNNLKDITMDPRYASMMGYTEEELKFTFADHIEAIAKERKTTGQEVVEEIRTWYNGYRFSEGEVYVYNPFSTLLYLDAMRAKSYWYRTGTPSFLIDEVRKCPESVLSLSGVSAMESTLSDISRLDRISLPALMFQTGYLTIQSCNLEENSYDLDFPNREVKEAFLNSLLQEFAEVDPLQVSRASAAVQTDLENFALEAFIAKMNTHFAKIAYPVFTHAKEGFYQAVFFTFLAKSGIAVQTEELTSRGRIDLVAQMPNAIYIFELKLDKKAQVALEQAETKKYAEKYSQEGKNLLILGITFDSKAHNIGDWKGLHYAPSGELLKEINPS